MYTPASAKMKGRPSVTLTGGLSGATAVGALLAAGAVLLAAAPPTFDALLLAGALLPVGAPLVAGAPAPLLAAGADVAGRPPVHPSTSPSATSSTTLCPR